MVDLYGAVAIQCNIPLVRKREEYKGIIKDVGRLLDSAVFVSETEVKVKLAVIPEASFQGFRDEFIDQDHLEYVRDFAIDIPGEETDQLAQKAKQHGLYLVASAKARMPEFPNRFFNTAFIIDPQGKIIHLHRKTMVWVREHSTTPHDLWDDWVKMFGEGLDAFFPVARTPIGNIGTTICMEGGFPEVFRGLAMNGAEIITRVTYPEPYVSQGRWEIQNRARALDNTCYLVSPDNTSLLTRGSNAPPIGGGNGGTSMIVDYFGRVLVKAEYAVETFVSAIINIDELRQVRASSKMLPLPYLKTEMFKKIYEKPLWPKNMYIDTPPGKLDKYTEVYENCVKELRRRGVWISPEESK